MPMAPADGGERQSKCADPSENTRSDVPSDWGEWAQTLIQTRQTVLPKRLQSPGPDEAQLQQILMAAAAAPDHRRLTPWRIVIVPTSARHRLATVFRQSLLARDPLATAEQLAQASDKAHRAPTLMLLIVNTLAADTGVDSAERLLSAGCAAQNMLLVATAMGFGSALTSGKALRSPQVSELFSMAQGEVAVCFISLGTVRHTRPKGARPELSTYVSSLSDGVQTEDQKCT